MELSASVINWRKAKWDPDIPPWTFLSPFLHDVGPPPHHRLAPIYIKRSTVNVHKIDSGSSQEYGLVSVF